jgi:transitional endoplasmic reticulum ATPase
MSDPLDDLKKALDFAPDNHVLRAHIVRELLKARRWEDAASTAQPLRQSPTHQPLENLVQARIAVINKQIDKARELYQQAIKADASLIDEALEAQLEPDVPLKLNHNEQSAEIKPVPTGDVVKRIGFDDIGGMEALKEQIRLTILYPILRPEIYEAYGKKIGGGIMLYGPPGCGKTHIARATASEMGAKFYVLALNEVLSQYVGETEKAITQIFETARATSPSVIFIDEVDALGSKRSDIQSASIRWMVSQFLTELDGVVSRNDKVMVLGATNAPWNVDSALRRPGRFDRVLFVPPPDQNARGEILKLHSRNRKIENGVDWSGLARQTEYFSGADLANLVERASEKALADALKSGVLRDVTQRDFGVALKECKPSTMEWLRRSRNYTNFANQDGIYDDLAEYLDKARIR